MKLGFKNTDVIVAAERGMHLPKALAKMQKHVFDSHPALLTALSCLFICCLILISFRFATKFRRVEKF